MLKRNPVIVASSDNMVSIFAGRDLEHPYRFQRRLSIEVPFTEYVQFVKDMVSMNVSKVLYFNLSRYEDCLRTGTVGVLRKYYLIDMSIAIQNEVAMSHATGNDATWIMHVFDDMEVRNLDLQGVSAFIDSSDVNNLRQVASYLTKCSPRVFDVRELSRHNTQLYFYAVSLWLLAKSGGSPDYWNLIR